MKTTVIFHRADFDGLFCAAIARKFLTDAELIGWDFGDPALPVPDGKLYVMDLPLDKPFGREFKDGELHTADGQYYIPKESKPNWSDVVWVDHHRSSIESHPSEIPGYRIDGVAACRLAWQWFVAWERYRAQGGTGVDANWFRDKYPFPQKQDFIDRKVFEPLAVRLAGEYDVFNRRNPNAELFQHGLRSEDVNFERLLSTITPDDAGDYVETLLSQGRSLQFARKNEYAEVIKQQGFNIQWEGLLWLACNSHELDIRSQLFEAGVKPEHDALLGFTWGGRDWRVSMYGVPSKPDVDVSKIAVRHSGGGHKHAAGFRCRKLPFDIGEVPF